MAKYKIEHTTQFKKDLKLAQKRGLDLKLLQNVVNKLAEGENLPVANRDHELTGFYKTFRECHIKPDWLLVYKHYSDKLILVLSRTGTHSDLF